MGLVAAVDLAVPVEAAGVGQLLAAHLAGHARLAVRAHLPRPIKRNTKIISRYGTVPIDEECAQKIHTGTYLFWCRFRNLGSCSTGTYLFYKKYA